MIYNAFLELAKNSKLTNPGVIARDATHGTLALLEGMWTDYFLHTTSFNV